jgi:hypothetical protein
MADLTITAASVLAGSGSTTVSGTLGETVTAGQAVYKSSTTNKWLKADSNSATAEVRRAGGIALNGGAVDQPVKVLTAGLITIGATVTAGTAYYLSDTPGGICPVADVGSGEYVCQLGISTSTTVLNVDIQFPNVAL